MLDQRGISGELRPGHSTGIKRADIFGICDQPFFFDRQRLLN